MLDLQAFFLFEMSKMDGPGFVPKFQLDLTVHMSGLAQNELDQASPATALHDLPTAFHGLPRPSTG